jgi:hypothetical protein
MSTVPAETNLTTVPAQLEIQSPDTETRKRSMAVMRTLTFCESIAVIRDGKLAELKIKVSSPDEYKRAGQLLLTAKSYMKDLEETFEPEKTRRFNSHRELCAELNRGMAPAEAIGKALSAAITDFQREAERKRQAEQKRLQDLARQQAEEEQRKRQEENALNAALEAEASGNTELAEQIISAPIDSTPAWVPPVILQSSVPKIDGLSSRTAWKARIKGDPGTADYDANFMLLVKAVAEGKAPMSLLKLNETALNQLGKAMKTQLNVPGCESYQDTGLAGRV